MLRWQDLFRWGGLRRPLSHPGSDYDDLHYHANSHDHTDPWMLPRVLHERGKLRGMPSGDVLKRPRGHQQRHLRSLPSGDVLGHSRGRQRGWLCPMRPWYLQALGTSGNILTMLEAQDTEVCCIKCDWRLSRIRCARACASGHCSRVSYGRSRMV